MIKARHIKNNEFIPGIPVGDLSDEQWNSLNEHQQKQAIESGVYELVEEKRSAPKADKEK